MVVVRVRCEREGGCVRLTALGLLAGCMIGALLELLQGPRPVVSAVQPEHSARALSLGGQPGHEQGVQGRSVQDGAGPPVRPPQRKTEPVVAEPSVAVCVGGWLELTYPRRAQSVADNVFSVMPAEAFVAGTLRGGNVTAARTSAALAGISALRPWFARTSVIRMPTPAELRTALEGSGHFGDYVTQASKGGSGRFDFKRPDSADPTTWVPIMMSPALGNPNGNTLQEFHYQSRCIRMVNDHEAEARAGRKYERVMFTRLEFEWLHPHPPLDLLDPALLWLPTGEDNTGLNDRHWLANRRDAEGIFRRWDALIAPPPHDIYHKIFFGGGDGKVRPAFMSSETFMKLHIQYHKVGVARFPSVAFLQCCARNYEQPAAGAQQMRCFAKGCTQTACPARQRLGGGGACSPDAPPTEPRRLGFKYRDEGFSAILHATALSFPGARLNFADDRTPPRLDIRLPASLGAELAQSTPTRAGGPAASADSYLYTCKTCESANFVDRVSYNVTACLFTEYVYPNAAMERARKGHNCRYFDDAPLAAVCHALAQGEHGTDLARLKSNYGWFCGDAIPLLEAAAKANA